MESTDKGIRLAFDHADSGLMTKGMELTGFTIAGEDRKFVTATATIDGATVVVTSHMVKDPVSVRYGWSANRTCNLYNEAKLPAVPFRTDDWLRQEP
jgi:sialate O-acetylesterase